MNNKMLKTLTENRETNAVVGNSVFCDDVWDLSNIIISASMPSSAKKIRFGDISNTELRMLIKDYLYFKLGQVKPQSVIQCRHSLQYLIKFCDMNGLQSLQQMSKDMLLEYNLWLREECRLSKRTGYTAMHMVEELIRLGNIKGWPVPSESILKGLSSAEIWGSGKDSNKYEPIPDDIFLKIINCAQSYDDILTKAGIIIQSQTGLRISEVLSIQSGCLHIEQFHPSYFEVFISKTSRSDPIIHKVFANDLVVKAIMELEDATRDLRNESGKKELFLTKNKGISVPNASRWSSTRLRTFIKRNNIRNAAGDLYSLKSHQFRSTFVRQLILKGVPIAFAMKQFSHVSIEMTSHYLQLQEAEVKKIYSEILLSPDNKLVGIRAKEIESARKPYFKGRSHRDYSEIIDSLAEGLTINPLPNGICLYDYRRGSCTDGDSCLFYNCPNFITERRFLPVLERELNLISDIMQRELKNGHDREWQRQNSKYQLLKPIVEELRGC